MPTTHPRRPRPPRASLLALLLGVLLLGPAACTKQRPRALSPEDTVMAFARAIGQGKLKEAYGLMSASYRKRVSYADFERSLKQNPQETLEITNALSHLGGKARQQATLRFGDDEELELRRMDGRWYISSNLVGFYDQSTPRAALRSFVRAMERKRYDVVMRLIPEADKEGVTPERMKEAWSGDAREEVERMLSNLREHMDAPIEEVGNRATMPYGDRLRVQFVREEGSWKIEDPE
ncbi:MAG: hypothetical protein OEZ06_01090 [Myxococcales bacterium]|nr:hypothetical protein [Myxococcales bacterium]